MMISIKNFNWNDLCNYTNDIKIINSLFDSIENFNKNSIVLSIKYPEYTDIKISTKEHSIPLMNTSTSVKPNIRINNACNKSYNNGIMIFQEENNYRYICYITFNDHKKIIYITQNVEGIHYPIFIQTSSKPSTVMEENFNLRQLTDYKNPDSRLTDREKVILVSVSKKFGKLLEECQTLKDIHIKLDKLFFETVDPYYMVKIIQIQELLLLKTTCNENTM